MLYPKTREPELSEELFRSPTCEYRSAPFWAWNCRLEREELLRQADILREMGFGGYHMHVRSGLSTEYLGDEFMDLISDCVNKAKKEKLLAWLYDEDRWPSGFAGGLVTKDEKYRMRYLLFTAVPYEKEGADTSVYANEQNRAKRSGVNAKLLARYDIILDEQGCLKDYRVLDDGEEARGLLRYAYIESPRNSPRYNGFTYVNTLDKKAIDRFIEITHEKYKDKIGSEFGKTVPGIRADGPQMTVKTVMKSPFSVDDVTLPYTDDLEDSFRKAYGFSLKEHLPELFWELPDGKVSYARYCYHDHTAERFAEAFSDNIGAWCKENGILFTGHLMREPSLDSQTSAVGETMRHYRGFTMPGIDMLAFRREYTTAKQAQSAVNQQGAEGMLDELYGVTTWDMDFRGYKTSGDWQAALGVTVRIPQPSRVSMEGEAKRDYPASINYQSPWYKEYSYIEDHFARVNTVMTRGNPVVRVGVIHPIESFWLCWGPNSQTAMHRAQLDREVSDLAEWLLFGGIDFAFSCESTLPAMNRSGEAPFTVGEMKYDVVIVPGCETLRSTTLERLEAFSRSGGKLIFAGRKPTLLDAKPSDRPAKLFSESTSVEFSRTGLLEALEPYRTVKLSTGSGSLTSNFLYRMRRDGDSLNLFIARGKEPANRDISKAEGIKITLPGHYKVKLYDTLKGNIKPMAYRHEGDSTVISANLHQADSLLLGLTPSEEAFVAPEVSAKPTESLTLPVCCENRYILDEPNALLLDLAEWAVDDEPMKPAEEILRIDTAVRKRFGWTPWGGSADQPWYLPKKAPDHTLHLRYTFRSKVGHAAPLLAIENPETAEVRFNSLPVNTSSPVGYYVDKSIKTVVLPDIKRGINTLEIDMPYGEATAAERVYILGEFAVNVKGYDLTVDRLPDKIGFGDITSQGLPFYSGKLTYIIPISAKKAGKLHVRAPKFRATLLRATLGEDSFPIAIAPYSACCNVKRGRRELKLDAYIPRTNGFGPIHCADEKITYQSPGCWRTSGGSWSYEYCLMPEGVISSPEVRLDHYGKKGKKE